MILSLNVDVSTVIYQNFWKKSIKRMETINTPPNIGQLQSLQKYILIYQRREKQNEFIRIIHNSINRKHNGISGYRVGDV